jgi:serine/threonine-protein kinase
MPLEVGSRLGHYHVTALIGEGGMGQVYQATDTKLNRQVALKILPEAFAADPDRLARFEREAQVLASLNHPGIAAIYGLEDSEGTTALVLELVEGPTLADRIAQGPVPLDDALPIAKQIAEALEAAHEAGVIHRDLKPANIKVREDGTVKVLDFGLAKALDPSPDAEPSVSPTVTVAATQMGVIMGTVAYMSPEQARGKSVDRRADVWAFGCVLYEMLTGQCAFAGEDVTDTLAAVVRADPEWQLLPDAMSPSLRLFMQRCLEKDAKHRVGDVRDIRLALEGAFEPETNTPAGMQGGQVAPGSRLSWVAALVLTAVVVGIGTWVLKPVPPPTPVARFSLPFETGQAPTGQMEFTADGSALVYVGPGESADDAQLWIRRWANLEATPMPGTEGAFSFALSPDEREVAFVSLDDGLLRVASLDGGPLRSLDIAARNVSGWGGDGSLYITYGVELARVLPTGRGDKAVEVLTELTEGQLSDSYLEILPGGMMGLFTVFVGADEEAEPQVWAVDLDSHERRFLTAGLKAKYASTGHLLYGTPDGVLMAASFDPATAELTGPTVPVVEGLYSEGGAPFFAVSKSGTLIYRAAGPNSGSQLVWVDATDGSGQEEPLPLPPGNYARPRVSPDGTRVALNVSDASGGSDLWVYDVKDGTGLRLTRESRRSRLFWGEWTPDGDYLVFAGSQDGDTTGTVFRVPANGSGAPEALATVEAESFAVNDVSPDGEVAVFGNVVDDDTWELVSVSIAGGAAAARPLLTGPFHHGSPTFSPDGNWLAYRSDETGQFEVYVTSYPEPSAKVPVSVGGGHWPVWAPDGQALFYESAGRLMTRSISTAPTLSLGRPEMVLDLSAYAPGTDNTPRQYEISPDGVRFLLLKPGRSEIHLVQNWYQELLERVPLP